MHLEARVVLVPQLADNYAYLLIDPAGIAAVIDPAEGGRVLEAVAREGVRLTAILNTHHHADHTGGNEALAAALPSLEVIGSAADAAKIPRLTRAVDDGAAIAVGALAGEVIFVPCHTR